MCVEKDPACRALAPVKNTKPQQNPLGLGKRKAARRRPVVVAAGFEPARHHAPGLQPGPSTTQANHQKT